MRIEGTVKTWNEAKGYGFLTIPGDGPDVFLHVSALPRGSAPPRIGEAFTFEIELNNEGKQRAKHVRRVGPSLMSASPPQNRQPPRRASFPWSGLLTTAAIAAGYYGYQHGYFSTAELPSIPSAEIQYFAPNAATNTQLMPEPNFQCDGRQYCSQMTSCAEAKYFIEHCPATQMDGDFDGEPCEEQWCSGVMRDGLELR